ncbi:hypothetical protein [Sorangium sp. So ce385]|uniref:hypothetical protein n=1 Tax=Sorangium sp. So ce385 TaxID=3133308 RepID=UPI003F5B7BC4
MADNESYLNGMPRKVVVSPDPDGPQVRVGLQRTGIEPTPDQTLWMHIRNGARAIAFDQYDAFLNWVLFEGSGPVLGLKEVPREELDKRGNRLPFAGVDAYAKLKAATEVFMMVVTGTSDLGGPQDPDAAAGILKNDPENMARLNQPWSVEQIKSQWRAYTRVELDSREAVLPYIRVVAQRLGAPVTSSSNAAANTPADLTYLLDKMRNPLFIELIWSYWHEEGMLVQTMNALSMRFQNRRGGPRDPLANMELDPLRPLNSYLWGFIQDEQHRLSVARRAYEYDHHYGFTLHGKAIPQPRTADSRTKFLEAFHNLLFQCVKFYNEDDDTTRIADGFPVLNSLKEVHILLTEGGHNQYGDLPWTARMEMMMMEWILARPEMREFLGGRPMVAYSESWMDRVDTMKTLQGWTRTNVMHFRDLGVFGEQILLSVRFGHWNTVVQPQQAANWARYWRAEIQGYIHAYRAVTGVELGALPTDGSATNQRFLPPSHHLRARLAEQQGRARIIGR